MGRPYFLTGALGCIGAWIVRALLERGDRPVVFDRSDDRRRLRLLLEAEALAAVDFVSGDVADAEAVRAALERSGARAAIHLAGLQVPACRADPLLGARVNVLGTLAVLEAARRAGIERVVYASSAAVFGRGGDDRPVREDATAEPATHYGVFKRAGEGCARVYWLEHGLSSVGLRPLTVYGVGRDAGLTSDPTRAMKAAVLGLPFRIRFTGATDFLFAGDAAAAFLAAADRAPAGAQVFNLHGESRSVAEAIRVIEASAPAARPGLIRAEGPELPLPPALDGGAAEAALGPLPRTPFEEGVARTMRRFARLEAEGRLDRADLQP